MKINLFFQQALLSEAAYANFWDEDRQEVITIDSRVKTALKAAGFSQTQASQFAQKYSIVHSQQNTVSGFSATVFKDTAGGYTFAIRGTEPSDFSADVLSADFGDIGGDGIALKQAVH